MALQVAALSFEAIEALRPLAARTRRQDRSLADQLVRAASSVALNIAEGDASEEAGSAALLLGRVLAMLKKLARR
jgi:four helix bundle protein